MRRTVLAALTAAAIAVPALTTAAFASAPTPTAAVTSQSSNSKGKSKPAKFSASGRVTAVDAGTITLYVRSGTKDVRKQTITVSVAGDALVRVNGRRAALSAIAAGYKVDLTGRSTGTGWTATKVVASGKVRVKPTPSVSPSTEPEDEHSTDPDDEHSTEPEVEHSAEPAHEHDDH